MEETHYLYNINCEHIASKDIEYVCVKCGCLMIRTSDDKYVFAIKPKKLNFKFETSVYLIFENMKNKINSEERNSVEKLSMLKDYLDFEEFKFKRKRIIKRLRSFITSFNFKLHTLHNAIYYFDLIFIKNISNLIRNLSEAYIISGGRKYSLELVSLGCLILAIKYHELEDRLMDLSMYNKIFPHEAFKIFDLKRVEIVCLQLLDYNLDHISSYSLIELLLSNGVLFNDDFQYNYFSSHASNSFIGNKNSLEEFKEFMKVYLLSSEILNFTIESKFLKINNINL
jgi:hypothetical protein